MEWFQRMFPCFVQSRFSTPEENLLRDLHEVMKQVSKEECIIESSSLSQHEKEKRLMYLFIRDLLPGLNGKILESKDSRTSFQLAKVASSTRAIGWIALFCVNAVFLFYIFLFAMRQSQARQSDWFLTFMIWIIFDITIASTMVVVVVHVIIPSLAMRDLYHLKKRLLNDLVTFKRQLGKKTVSDKIFNAAEYLFVSHHVAHDYPSLEQSKVILEFSTPWPKRSYKAKRKDVKRSYQKNYSFFIQVAERMFIFALTNFLAIPHSLQDTLMHMFLTSGLGYMMSVFMKLYNISPALVGVPIIGIFLVIHFWIRSDKRSQQLKELSLVPEVEKSIKMKSNLVTVDVAHAQQDEGPLHLPSPVSESTNRLKTRRASLQEATSLGLKLIDMTKQRLEESLNDESQSDSVDPSHLILNDSSVLDNESDEVNWRGWLEEKFDSLSEKGSNSRITPYHSIDWGSSSSQQTFHWEVESEDKSRSTEEGSQSSQHSSDESSSDDN